MTKIEIRFWRISKIKGKQVVNGNHLENWEVTHILTEKWKKQTMNCIQFLSAAIACKNFSIVICLSSSSQVKFFILFSRSWSILCFRLRMGDTILLNKLNILSVLRLSWSFIPSMNLKKLLLFGIDRFKEEWNASNDDTVLIFKYATDKEFSSFFNYGFQEKKIKVYL